MLEYIFISFVIGWFILCVHREVVVQAVQSSVSVIHFLPSLTVLWNIQLTMAIVINVIKSRRVTHNLAVCHDIAANAMQYCFGAIIVHFIADIIKCCRK